MKNLIVIPAFNEEVALPRTLLDLQGLGADFEVLIVNDGSTDHTQEVAERLVKESRLPVHVVQLPLNCGIGVAVQTGYLFAAARDTYRYVIQFDADGQHDAAAIPELIAECEKSELDLVVGSRFLGAEHVGFRSTFSRRIGIRFFCWLIALLSGVRVSDPTSGFRCAGPRAWKSFAKSYPTDYPEPESLYWCVRNSLRIGETPVKMRARQGGVSSIRYWKPLYYMLKVSLSILIERLRAKEYAL